MAKDKKTEGDETEASVEEPAAEPKPKRSRKKAEPTEAPAAETTSQPEAPVAPAGDPVAEESAAESEPEPVAEEPAPEPQAAEATEEPEPEPVAEAEPEPTVAEAEPEPEPEAAAAEAEAPEPEPEPEPAAPAPAAKEKPKRKRLPRAQRPTRTRPKRETPKTRKPIVRLPKPESERGRRQERRGVVVSSAMDKTIVVKVDTIKAHPRYKKVVRRSTKFHAHDEQNAAKVGDIVRIVETRPLSTTKNWRLAEGVEAAKRSSRRAAYARPTTR